MLIERDPWAIVMFRMEAGKLSEVGKSTIENSKILPSEVVPLKWQLLLVKGKITIKVSHDDGQQQWVIEPAIK